ncbi:MAG: MOP flippase family protein [Bryobacterales bacterium]|nr:MOP flippase family protein [Bryobacterales bacterium]
MSGGETLTRKAVSGISWSMASVIGRQVLSFGAVAVLARILGPEAYGLIGMANVVTGFVVQFRDLGTGAAVVQRQSISPRMLSSVFWFNLLVGIVLGSGVFLLAGPAVSFFHDARVKPILQVMSLALPLASLSVVQQSLMSREMAFERLAVLEFVTSLIAYAAALGCALSGMGPWSLVVLNLASSFVSTAMLWFLSSWRPSWVFDREEIRSVWAFSLNLSGFGLVNYFSRNADNLIVGRVLGSAPLGYYQMAYNLMLYPIQNITSVISRVLFPAFAKIQDDDERFRSAYVRSCLLIGLVTFPVMAGLGVVADPFLRVVLGAKWIPAIATFQILAPVGMFQSVLGTVGQIYVAKGRTDLMLYWGIYGSAVMVISFLIGVPYGIAGVATAYSIAFYTLILYPVSVIPFRLIGLRFADFARPFIPQLLLTVTMSVVCVGWLRVLNVFAADNHWLRLLSTVALGAFIYGGGILWWRPPGLLHLEEVLRPATSTAARRLLRLIGRFA